MADIRKGFLFRTDGTSQLVIYDGVDDITRLVGVDEWTAVYRNFSGIDCVVYIDDLGILRDNYVITAVSRDFSNFLVGNLLIARSGSGGEDESITEEDFWKLTNNIITLFKTDEHDCKIPIMDVMMFN